jgi:Trypsin-like peptidase domain
VTSRAPSGLLSTLRLLTAEPGGRALDEVAPALAPLRQARALIDARLVAGVGISEKTSDGQRTGVPSLCFYVRQKLPLRRLRGDRVVPPYVRAPDARTYPTDVKEIGVVRLHHAVGASLRCGASVSRSGDPAGSVGALVRHHGRLCILSNAHVLARSGKAKIGDMVISPGTTDGGQMPTDHVARLVGFVPFDKAGVNRVDAAVAEVLPERLPAVHAAIPGVVVPVRTTPARRGMVVTKVGKSTQSTQAEITDVNFRLVLPYPAGVGLVRFVDQILCTAFAEPGDSGALVVDTATGRVVGLHFSGSDTVSVCNPIGPVIDALGISFET